MTLFLPENIDLFREAFESTCNRILTSKKLASFCALLAGLVCKLQEHPLLKDFFAELEAKSFERKKQFESESLAVFEDIWIKLWELHSHSLKYRKKLISIKRIVTSPTYRSSSALYSRILMQLRDFHSFSPLIKSLELFKDAQSQILREKSIYGQLKEQFFSRRKITSSRPKKRNNLNFHEQIFSQDLSTIKTFEHQAKQLHIDPFGQKITEIEKKFFIPGQNDLEKRDLMRTKAEIDPIFCWVRIQSFNQVYSAKTTPPALIPFKGRWPLIRDTAWFNAQARCEEETLISAKRAFVYKLRAENPAVTKNISSSSLDTFVPCEYQVHRGDCEKYLDFLGNHIQAQLFQIRDQQKKAEENPLSALPGTLKANFVIHLAQKFWKAERGGHDQAFEYYKTHCPFPQLLKRDQWNKIIRKHGLDPRSPEEKKRGPGKKTCKK